MVVAMAVGVAMVIVVRAKAVVAARLKQRAEKISLVSLF